MANILYGVNGEGAGHSTRSKEVLTHLREQGHTLHVASFDRGMQNLRDQFEVTEIFGFRFAYVNNRVRYKRTIAKNLITVPQAAKSANRLKNLIATWKIDLVITDFEPLSCHVAHRMGLPVISIDNQHCLTNAVVSYPPQYRSDAAAAKLVTKLMTPHADAYLVISFFSAPVKKRNTFLFPPLLRQEILEAAPTQGEHVLVYVTSPAPSLAKALAAARGRFVAYGFGRDGEYGNVVYKKFSLEGFMRDLTSAQAGKPYLAVPVKHQFEQIFNAHWLAKMGYGAYWEGLNKERVESFLYDLPLYREKLADYPRQGNGALLAKLDSLIGEYAKK
jgi:uncharacterized protein (TIGR00661 family)